MRSLWSGSLSFGLINIPVQLYSGSEEHAINLDMLHKKDLSPIRYARICKAEEKEVPYNEIVKGYEYQKGEYVLIEDEDFKQVHAKKSDAIEILSFTKETEIDPIYFEKPYFLEPGKGANKPYALLREALSKSGKVGVVKFALRNKEHIGVIKPYGEAIILNQMRFASEIRALDYLKLPDEKVDKKELEMALKLVDQLTESFHVEEYKDTSQERLEELIQDKLQGHTPAKIGQAAAPSKIHDIMSLLKASLEKPKKTATPSKAKSKKRA